MKRNYDNVAIFYDRFARLIYGTALREAQVYLLKAIPPNSRILIAGGGTGWILEEIANIHPSGLTLTYVDSSAKMIAITKKRKAGENRVSFITAPIQDAIIDNQYDVVITPFFLDNFTDESLQKVFSRLDIRLAPKGMWFYCDFQNTDVLWQKSVLKAMYLFFRTFCGVEASHLPDADACFAQKGYVMVAEKQFLKGFVTARIYEKG